MNLLSVEPVVFHVFQLMLGKLKSRNNLYPALLHIRSIREHILRLLSIEVFGDLYSVVSDFNVVDPLLNFSDHRPVIISSLSSVGHHQHPGNVTADPNLSNPKTSYLRWDRANLAAYRELTIVYLSQIISDLCEAEKTGVTVDTIDLFYDSD